MNNVHPSALISDEVVLGAGNTIGPFVVISGAVTIGDDNWFGAGVVIGAPPEVRSFPHPRSTAEPAGGGIVIGSRNTIREYAQIHHGWRGETTIGDDAFIMNQCYIAHDSSLGHGVTMASSVLLAGHVKLGDGANLGLGTAVHQFREVGRGAMVGMASVVTRTVPPFAKAYGNPASVRGANVVGMERAGVDPELIRVLTALYGAANPADAVLESSSLGAIQDDAVREAVLRWTQRER